MLPVTKNPPSADWEMEIAWAVCNPFELCRLLDLPSEVAKAALGAVREYRLWAPRPFIARMRHGDPRDPLLLQVLPQAAELAEVPGFGPDPLGESSSMPEPGLLWKYQGRVLVVATGACAVHCRFCFRRHFPFFGGESEAGPDGSIARGDSRQGDRPLFPGDSACFDNRGSRAGKKATVRVRQVAAHCLLDLDRILNRVAVEPSTHEVILSGGDPLMLTDFEIAYVVRRLADMPHVTRIRIHSRLPVMIPGRVTDGLLAALRRSRLAPVLVVHINHPAEIDDDVAAALGRVADAGIPVLSQGVLLRGINDDVETLAALYERLVDLRVMPYYLHQLDAVAGAAHFEVPVEEGVALMRALRARLPGYAVPRYVRETRMGACKELLE
jgi:L-lysine 2,3-aminomutase